MNKERTFRAMEDIEITFHFNDSWNYAENYTYFKEQFLDTKIFVKSDDNPLINWYMIKKDKRLSYDVFVEVLDFLKNTDISGFMGGHPDCDYSLLFQEVSPAEEILDMVLAQEETNVEYHIDYENGYNNMITLTLYQGFDFEVYEIDFAQSEYLESKGIEIKKGRRNE